MPPQRRLFSSASGFYIGKSTIFKTFLLTGIAVISAFFIWYTFSVIDELQTDTRSQVEKYVKLWQMAANSPTIGSELQFIFNEIIVKANFPIIVLDNRREPIHWRNVAGIPADTTAETIGRLKEIAADMKESNGEFPIFFGEEYVNYFYYGDPAVITQLRYMPFIEIGIVLAFMIVGLIGFQNIRRSEERHIWVGMAKETAHQLGTPISSLMGWLEVLDGSALRDMSREDAGKHLADTVENMQVDVRRLNKVANRFGKIGSRPELKPCAISDVVEEVVNYYRRRLPFEGKGIRIEFQGAETPDVPLNDELLSWALENLVKNALQAVDAKSGRVEIGIATDRDRRHVTVTLTDNGRGISAAAARKIFRPGFTTKKRGWGLGLTLVRRIVEEYHQGRVWLEHSRPGETVFKLQLPVGKTA